LESAGRDVLLDDRPKVSPGVKFGDAELIGVPTIVIVGRGAADGVVELWDRRSGARRELPAAELLGAL
jgi:prolyl-tRNA synthetase